MIKKWWCWVKDGDDFIVFQSEKHKWDEVPQHGILYLLTQTEDNRFQHWQGRDLYFFDGKHVGNSDDRDGVLRLFCPQVKWGDWTTPDIMVKVSENVRKVKDGS